MKVKSKILVAAVLASLAGTTFGANTALTVTGKITPGACEGTLSTSTLEFGEVKANTLNANINEWTALAPKSVKLSFKCKFGTLIAFSVVDVGGVDTPSSAGRYAFGDAGEFEIKNKGFWMGSVAISGVSSAVGDANWAIVPANAAFNKAPVRYSFAIRSGSPTTIAGAAVELSVEPFIKPSKQLDIDKEISMAGTVTFQLMYL